MGPIPFLNSKRLRDYPRLILIASASVVLLNIVLNHGWVGGITGLLLWADFIDYYGAGQLYIKDISHLYDPAYQVDYQLRLLYPNDPQAFTFYSYPPNAALIHSLMTHISLPLSIVLWCFASISFIVITSYLIKHYLFPQGLAKPNISTLQISILIFSSLAFIEGFVEGQMHSLILLIIVALVVSTIKEKWFLSGFFGALLLFKPQYVIGFILIWLIWKKFYALITFISFSSVWHGFVLLTKGITPYIDYINFVKGLTYLPYMKEGFPITILATPYTFIASTLSMKYASIWNFIFICIFSIIIIGFCLFAYKNRTLAPSKQNLVLSMAILLPLIITPYALLHDLLILVPAIILLLDEEDRKKEILILAITVYIAVFTFPLVSLAIKYAVTGLIPIMVLFICIKRSLVVLKRNDAV